MVSGILVFLLIPFLIGAQTEKTDSVSRLLQTDKNDTTKVNHLLELVYLNDRSNPDSAFARCKEALALSEKLQWQKGIGLSCHKIASLHDAKGEYPLALQNYSRALKIWNELEQSKEVSHEMFNIKTRKTRTLTNIGNDHAMLGNFPKALEYSLEALKLAKEIDNKHLQANNFGNIGSVFNKQKEFEKALEYYFKALKIYEGLRLKGGLAYCYIGIGNTYNDKKDYEQALEYYFRASKINEETGNKSYMAANFGNIGNAYSRQNKNDKALEYFEKALKIDEETGNKVGMAYRLSSIGSLYVKLKKYNEAEKYLTKGLELSDSTGSLQLMQDNHNSLSELYSEKGDFKRSLDHFNQYSILKDSLFNEEKEKELTRHELNYEFEKKESELKAEQDKKEAVMLAERKRQQVLFWLICFVTLAISVIALIILRSLRITKKQKIIIEEQKETVEAKQKEILDSIHYAKRIQQSLLPTDKYIERNIFRLKK
jgi:tetratricopeptide (TPR) repeat protein